jgi:hypothetical protein
MALTKVRPSSSPKGAMQAKGGVEIGNGVWLFTNAGTPVAGTSGTGAGWAGKGSKCVDHTNGVDYINTGTKASPTWTVVGAQT